MDFQVMSRERCEKYSRTKHKKTSAIVSIKSSWDRVWPDLDMTDDNNIKDILFLDFDDIDIDAKNASDCFITKDDARKIAHFIEKHRADVDVLICHCDGGISRSAGVSAAAQRYLTDNDSQLFRSHTKYPNMGVYLAVIKAFEEEYGWSINNYMKEK